MKTRTAATYPLTSATRMLASFYAMALTRYFRDHRPGSVTDDPIIRPHLQSERLLAGQILCVRHERERVDWGGSNCVFNRRVSWAGPCHNAGEHQDCGNAE